jgi:hypothetical protein
VVSLTSLRYFLPPCDRRSIYNTKFESMPCGVFFSFVIDDDEDIVGSDSEKGRDVGQDDVLVLCGLVEVG